ncbi:iron-uptake system permease protein FeuB [Oxobacter pfennigii]|uniref:Iron-uptake system permease protein FeuB n=1 Tax=Oxobacter pfennigii TaxID=36849 RepID=A0A0P8YZB2_9CLOT|nr:iron chelate uptake ABC transporter family permease subunit [Oxobacter pfennigii]KPU45203.1 iron-uptake system permease protein FeuB [Oxobacter pfennigii]
MEIRLKAAYFWQWKRISIIVLFLILLTASLMIGSSASVSFNALFNKDLTAWSVLWHSRIPRTAAIILSAAGLSVAGLIMQAISRNKFMSPSTSGTTDAAAFGLLLSYIFLNQQPGIVQTLFAFVFAFFSTLIFTSVINRLKIREVVYIPLIGMMYGGLISALTTAVAYRFDVMQMMTAINLGSFARIGDFSTVYIVILPLVFAITYSTRFSIIGMGEDFSKNLGLNYNRVVFVGLVIIALISAATFVAVGPLPFVGLIIPNMATSFYGDNMKKSIIDLMFFGADFVLVCDVLSRLVIHPFEMSVSLTISIIGGIIFMIYLIRGLRGAKKIKTAN